MGIAVSQEILDNIESLHSKAGDLTYEQRLTLLYTKFDSVLIQSTLGALKSETRGSGAWDSTIVRTLEAIEKLTSMNDVEHGEEMDDDMTIGYEQKLPVPRAAPSKIEA